MIKTDFRHQESSQTKFSPFFSMPTVLFGLGFGLLGALTNTVLHIHFLGNFGLFFGQIFVLFCLVNRGLNVAILTALISSIAAALNANDPFLLVIFLLELIFVHVSMRRGLFLFKSVMSYWLMIGIPLFLILHTLTSSVSAELLFVGSVTLAVNSLICVSIVAISCWFLPSHFIYKKYYTRPPPLASLIFSLCMLTVTLPAMLIALFFIWQSSIVNEKIVKQALVSSTEQLVSVNNVELQRHLQSVITVSEIIQNNPQSNIQTLFNATLKNNRLFQAMVLTDKYARVVSGAPHSLNGTLDKLSVCHRQRIGDSSPSRSVESAFMSDAMISSGHNENVSICFTAPFPNTEMYGGTVQGVMPLAQFASFIEQHLPANYLYVITDNKGRIIAKTDALKHPLLSNFDFTRYQDQLIPNVPTLIVNQSPYMYHQSETDNGWTLTLLQRTDKITALLVHYFFLLITCTIIALGIFAWVAKSLSRRISKPLVDIANNLPNKAIHPRVIRDSQISSETVKLTKKLIDSQEIMSNFHQQLSQQVEQKTTQLKKLNRELYSIAQKDSLTQLLNRAGFNRLAIASYRNCMRNQITMSLILIDIDHFKRINDTYGHPFGDTCIVSVANTIQKHCKRDTDIIGRFGGEEFIIMIVGGGVDEHEERIAKIKKDIQHTRFNAAHDSVRMTISAGICSIANNFSIDYPDLLQLSDNQLYISKREGRNKISSIIQ